MFRIKRKELFTELVRANEVVIGDVLEFFNKGYVVRHITPTFTVTGLTRVRIVASRTTKLLGFYPFTETLTTEEFDAARMSKCVN